MKKEQNKKASSLNMKVFQSRNEESANYRRLSGAIEQDSFFLYFTYTSAVFQTSSFFMKIASDEWYF